MRKLSDLQQDILRFVLANDTGHSWGTRWGSRGWVRSDDATRSDDASVSRAVARLEKRGLLVRNNHVSGPVSDGLITKHRTTHLELTDAGRAGSGTVNKNNCCFC